MPRIGLDVGGSKIEGILLDDGGIIAARQRMATPKYDYTATIGVIARLVEQLDRIAGSRCAVGVGTPGALDPSTGRMKNCNSTWLNGRTLLADLMELLGKRVRIANDADCFALSEAIDGAGSGASSVFGVILGTGVGGGIVIDGRLVAGVNGIAGEWGHTPLPYLRSGTTVPSAALESRLTDRLCYCGRENCIETFLSGPGLAATHRELWGGASLQAIEIASSDDPRCAASIELYCGQLARALAQIINILDPEVIVLGGGVSEVSALYGRVPELWPAYVFSDKVATRLHRATHGPTSGVRGAAWLWPADYNLDSS